MHRFKCPFLAMPAPTSEFEVWSGEPAASYKWTSWVWEITGWNSRLQENRRIILEEYIEYTQIIKGKAEDVNM